jgi:hypothetical protein
VRPERFSKNTLKRIRKEEINFVSFLLSFISLKLIEKFAYTHYTHTYLFNQEWLSNESDFSHLSLSREI